VTEGRGKTEAKSETSRRLQGERGTYRAGKIQICGQKEKKSYKAGKEAKGKDILTYLCTELSPS
jgi:hypothetical protein